MTPKVLVPAARGGHDTGALLGLGLLLVPGLAAKTAGPASTLAWLALLGASALLAMVFGALGRKAPAANGVAGYAQGRPRPGGGGAHPASGSWLAW